MFCIEFHQHSVLTPPCCFAQDGELAEKLYQKPVAMARTNPDRASHWPIPEVWQAG